MPLSLAQAHVLIAAANDHALANGWKIAVAVVDEVGRLVALGRMDGAFPLSSQIAEAKAAGAALCTATASSSPTAGPTRILRRRQRARPATAHPRPRRS